MAATPMLVSPDGNDQYGYVVHAPLDSSGKLDPTLWRERREHCTVRRFHPHETPADGWLRHRGDNWYFWYDQEDEGPEEPLFKLGAHELLPGEHVTVREADDDALTFRVAEAGASLARSVLRTMHGNPGRPLRPFACSGQAPDLDAKLW